MSFACLQKSCFLFYIIVTQKVTTVFELWFSLSLNQREFKYFGVFLVSNRPKDITDSVSGNTFVTFSVEPMENILKNI